MDAINTLFDELQIGLLCEKYNEEDDTSIVLTRDALIPVHAALRRMNRRIFMTDVALNDGFDVQLYDEVTRVWTLHFEEVPSSVSFQHFKEFIPMRYTDSKVVMVPLSGRKTMYMIDTSRYPSSITTLAPMSDRRGNEWNYLNNSSYIIAACCGRHVFFVTKFGDVFSINIDTMTASPWYRTTGFPAIMPESMFSMNTCIAVDTDEGVVIYIMLGYVDPMNTRVYLKYTHRTYTFSQLSWPINTPIMRFACTLLINGNILLTGGRDNTSTTVYKHAFEYDTAADKWTPVSPMLQERAYHTSARLSNGDVMVMCGELDDGSVTGSCEIYDIRKEQWREAPRCEKHMFAQPIALGFSD